LGSAKLRGLRKEAQRGTYATVERRNILHLRVLEMLGNAKMDRKTFKFLLNLNEEIVCKTTELRNLVTFLF
jgi:hypothetical protein